MCITQVIMCITQRIIRYLSERGWDIFSSFEQYNT